MTEYLPVIPLGGGKSLGWGPFKVWSGQQLVNSHPVEVTFQGGYYVAQSLTKQWQDPRLVGKGPLLSQGQAKSKKP